MSKKQLNRIKDFNNIDDYIYQRHKRGKELTPEILEYRDDLLYESLSWHKKISTESPTQIKERIAEARRYTQGISEYLEETL